jgi:Mn2+/Fe2+ NRAMP family transporter
MGELTRFLLIHLGTPLVGLGLYALFCRLMNAQHVPEPPYLAYFFLFFTFGGWLMVLLTAYFWKWSGMASLGVFYLMWFAPLMAVAIGIVQYSKRRDSAFHRWAMWICFGYTVIIVILNVLWLSH